MSKDHSDQDTRLTPNKYTHERLRLSAIEQTQQALEYYTYTRKDYLQETKKQFIEKLQLQRSGLKSVKEEKQEEKRRIDKKKKKKKVRENPEKQPTRITRKRRFDFRQPSLSSSENQIQPQPRKIRVKLSQIEPQKPNVLMEESLQVEEGPFKLKPIHEHLLQLQKTIDNFIEYQFMHRKRKSVELQSLFDFLKTTQYGLNCKKYFGYLKRYNSSLYEIRQERVFYHSDIEGNIEQRANKTKIRMTNIEIQELCI